MAAENTKAESAKKALVNAGVNAGFFSRYRVLLLAISAFLIMVVTLMIYSTNLSNAIRHINTEHAVSTKLQYASHNLLQNLFNLKISYGEDPSSPHIVHALKNLSEAQNDFQTSIDLLRKGGTFTNESGMGVNVSALTDPDDIARVNRINELWVPLSAQISTYLKDATSPTANVANLDIAVMSAQNSHERVHNDIEAVVQRLNGLLDQRTSALSNAQLGGVIGSVVFFLLFVFIIMRQLNVADAKAEEARNQTNEIMNTVSSGLFLLDKDLTIGSQYSKELERLIGQKDLGGRNLVEVLGNLISQDDLNTTHSFIGQLYNPRVKERLIGSLNPLTRQQMTVREGNADVLRYLDFKFNRVYSGDEISRVLVNVSDVTDAVLLESKIQQEREQNDVQLEMLSTILRADRQNIDDFVRNTQKHSMAINNILKAPGERQSELRGKAEHIFREIHSLKGEAYALNLHGFTVIAENIESDLKVLQAKSTLSGEDFLGLAVHLEELMNLTQTIEYLVSRLGNSDIHTNNNTSNKPRMANYYEQLVSDVAERNSKIVDFNYVGVEQVENEDLRTTIHEVAVQLLRNAVVHGIETPTERHARRKLEAGHVRMELLDNGSQYVLQLEDDGNGIDYEAIRAKAVRLGRYTEEQAKKLGTKELLALMFSSGFSTVEKATGDAGRGVGLDVIKDRVNKLGGKINISTSAGAYTRFTFTFPK